VWLQFLVSRVLSRALVALGVLAVIPLGRSLPNASCSLPRGSGWQPSNAPLHGLAPDGVCRAATVTGCAVGSYSTFSPLPEALTRFGRSNFLWHFPRGHPHRALPGILPCGARTFLGLVVKRACDRLRCCNGRELRCSVAGVQVLVGRARAVERDLLRSCGRTGRGKERGDRDPGMHLVRRVVAGGCGRDERQCDARVPDLRGVVDVEPAVAAGKLGDARLQLFLGAGFELAGAFA